MAVVNLQIVNPVNGAIFEGSGAVQLQGAITSAGHPALFPKWYSSLGAPPTASSREAAIPVPAGGNVLNFAPSGGLPLGSQTLTLAVKDQPGESPAELQAVSHAGMSGGPAIAANPAPCIVHVLIADLRAPASGATLSKAGAVLDARAPSQWAAPPATPDPLYINQLRYRWRFTPAGLPAGRATADWMPLPVFVPPGANGAPPPVPLLRFSGKLPQALGTGSYMLTLRVEHAANAARGHETSIPVVLTP